TKTKKLIQTMKKQGVILQKEAGVAQTAPTVQGKTTNFPSDYNGIPYYEVEYAGVASHSTWGYYFFGNIGYRYQPSHGFQFRVGISPSFNFGGDHAVSKNLAPYISFGFVF
ncbi:MAG: hypothetical protein J6T03_06415, partial [Bacteroidales bacterium]|nr:hypothetical protein [Bacteroidales bacterium]